MGDGVIFEGVLGSALGALQSYSRLDDEAFFARQTSLEYLETLILQSCLRRQKLEKSVDFVGQGKGDSPKWIHGGLKIPLKGLRSRGGARIGIGIRSFHEDDRRLSRFLIVLNAGCDHLDLRSRRWNGVRRRKESRVGDGSIDVSAQDAPTDRVILDALTDFIDEDGSVELLSPARREDDAKGTQGDSNPGHGAAGASRHS